MIDEIEKIQSQLEKVFSDENKQAKFLQYHHKGSCVNPCDDCPEKNNRIFENNSLKPPVGEENHPHCDCYYSNIETKPVGSISIMGLNSPDVYLKTYGYLPDYYITKQEAISIYGWNNARNTIAGKAPGKMIGNEIYFNDKNILPVKEGRIWYECDVDYVSGSRSNKRLFYSNDGLMFFSTDHGQTKFYLVE